MRRGARLRGGAAHQRRPPHIAATAAGTAAEETQQPRNGGKAQSNTRPRHLRTWRLHKNKDKAGTGNAERRPTDCMRGVGRAEGRGQL